MFDEDEDVIEAYCVSCKAKVPMENPMPVYTRRGAPGTRATCPDCGATIFRMGRTDAHSELPKPKVTDTRPEVSKHKGIGGAQTVAYINYAPADSDFAHHLAANLEKMGIPAWVDFDENADQITWASGAHPAFDECTHMIVVLSKNVNERVEKSWETFRQRRKPVFIAQLGDVEVPDELRSRPRYDFTDEFKPAFRRMIQVLMD